MKRVCINWDFNSKDHLNLVHNSTETRKVIQTMPEWIKLKHNELENCNIFFSIDDWNDWIRNNHFTFALGNRFHGNMMCYLNEIPTLWIVKDNRVSELTETLGLPSMILKQRKYDVNEFLKEKYYSYGFYLKRKKIRKEYIGFLNENGICHKFEME